MDPDFKQRVQNQFHDCIEELTPMSTDADMFTFDARKSTRNIKLDVGKGIIKKRTSDKNRIDTDFSFGGKSRDSSKKMNT